MDYGLSDSSGTDDDIPPSHQNRLARVVHVPGDGRTTGLSNLPYNRVQNDVEHEIHCLEQEAYCAVLRAFKAQSDVLTWEKEDLMTDLRKELRVSDDEHRELLGRVNADAMIKNIREWRQAGGFQHSVHVGAKPGQEPKPTVSVSRKKMKTSHSVGSFSIGTPSSAGHPRAAAAHMQLPASAQKRGAVSHTMAVTNPMRSASFPSGGQARWGEATNRSLSGAFAPREPTEAGTTDPLIGRKVMRRRPEDNNFYEAVIADYDAKEGWHALVYDINTKRETWDWVILKEISPEDILWEGEDPGISHRAHGGPRHGIKRSMSRVGATGAGTGRGALKCQSSQHFSPPQNSVGKDGPDIIDMLHTESLIKEMDGIFHGSDPDPVEIEKAKILLKEHEKTLIDAISNIARLEDASYGGSEEGDHLFSEGQTTDRQ